MFINETGIVQALLTNMDLTVTGGLVLTFGLLTLLLVVIAVMFRMPIELISLILTP